jgi:nucleoside 2-deoxyribosyltransferase
LDNLFEKELLPACEKYGYKPIRVDINEPTQTITDYIIESILKCECVIADLTYARPSVYFEVGFAHGQGIPLLLTCRKDHFKGKSDSLRVHFDLEQYKISYWLIDKNNNFNWAAKMSPTMRLKNLIKSKFKIDSNNKN